MPRVFSILLLLVLPVSVLALDAVQPQWADSEGPALGEVVEPGSFNPYAQLQEDLPPESVSTTDEAPPAQTFALAPDGSAGPDAVKLCRSFCENGIWKAN
ncbi:MAG TPA: hypothetical protein VLC08_12720 [Chitinolyticbacter sp.]|uniref:hypothetical protein n=1 Tax=Chitinolyticbacter albus TaxID=2961951 RepID=UPI0021099328|nr:hypothetical protein [Chitinolyticbacter albus]HSC81212.1 hypothetical protein [Chitinolyticbacter sp.]